MFKRIIKAYLENRLNALDIEVEKLAEEYSLDIIEAEQQSIIKQALFQIDSKLRKRIIILQSKIFIYKSIFGDLYTEENK